MKSCEIKTKLLHYWRFTRDGYNFIATEAGKFKSDVLVSNGVDEIIECEVKIDKYDLRDDFKKNKHVIYKKPTTWYSKWLPNKFFFAVPKDLVESALKYVENTDYGVIEVLDKPITKNKRDVYCKIVRQAKTMQPAFKDKLHRQIVMRESSELIRLRIKQLSS